jgi:hypothetical protein
VSEIAIFRGALKEPLKTAISSTQPADSHCGIRAALAVARVFQSFLKMGFLINTIQRIYSPINANMLGIAEVIAFSLSAQSDCPLHCGDYS